MALFDDLSTIFGAYATKINSLKSNLGNIANLDTSVKTSIVDAINAAQADIDDAKADVVTDDIKAALLTLVSHIALYDDGKGDEYCDALRDALYGIEYPDLRTGEIHYGGYYDADGEVQPTDFAYYNDKYFPIQPDTDYIWIRGFDGSVFKINDVYKSGCMAHRVCYYNEDKEFISREISAFNDTFGYIEPRYFVLNPPEGAKYFRVSWNGNPVGNIYRSIPYDLYAVSIVLANRDDSAIPYNTTLLNGVTFKREGVEILNDVVYGRNDMQMPLYYGDIPDNNETNSNVLVSKSQWFRNVFNILGGGTPEEDQKNPDTATRIQNKFAFLMKKGDVISFSGVKAGVRAERIADGHVQHSTAWITTDTDFVIGGDE